MWGGVCLPVDVYTVRVLSVPCVELRDFVDFEFDQCSNLDILNK